MISAIIDNNIVFLDNENYRSIVDTDGNSVKFEILFDPDQIEKLDNYNITRVFIGDPDIPSDKIVFIGESVNDINFEGSSEIEIMQFRNIEGSLFDRLIHNIDYYRIYSNDSIIEPYDLNLGRK